jgi:hypothetical protein
MRRSTLSRVVDILSTPPPPSQAKEPNAIINARRLYQSCMDESTIENDGVVSIMHIIESEFGGWPILSGSKWSETNFDLAKLFLTLRKYNNNPIYRVGTAINERNSSVYDIEVSVSNSVRSNSMPCSLSVGSGRYWSWTEKLLSK